MHPGVAVIKVPPLSVSAPQDHFPGSPLSIQQDSAFGPELQHVIEIHDVATEKHEPVSLRLKEKNAVVQGLHALVRGVAQKPAHQTGHQGGFRERVRLRGEDPVRRHGPDKIADLFHHTFRPCIARVEPANRVHEFLDGHHGMTKMPLSEQVIQMLRRLVLELIDINAGVQEQSWANLRLRT